MTISAKALPLVSIVIPCFNAGETIERCLRSCFAQTHSRLEIIVVDNNCTDDTVPRAERLARDLRYPITVTQCPDQGVTYARNAGVEMACGDYLQLLDADDQLGVDKIARQARALEDNPEFDLAFGDWVWTLTNESGQTLRLALQSTQYDDYLMQLLVDNWRPPHAYLLRGGSFPVASPQRDFSTDTKYADDREYFTRAALLGLRFLYVSNSPVQYNTWSSSQMTRSIAAQVRVDALAQIFRRFRELAGRAPQPVLSELHHELLAQDWACWQMTTSPPGGQALGAGARLTASVLRRTQSANTLEHLARIVVRVLCLDTASKLAGDGAKVSLADVQRAMTERLNPQGSQVLAPAVPDQSLVACNVGIGELMTRGPLYLPLFAQQRVSVLRHLHALRAAGLLQRVDPDVALTPGGST